MADAPGILSTGWLVENLGNPEFVVRLFIEDLVESRLENEEALKTIYALEDMIDKFAADFESSSTPGLGLIGKELRNRLAEVLPERTPKEERQDFPDYRALLRALVDQLNEPNRGAAWRDAYEDASRALGDI